ncbi:MAG: hypothetical protein R2771_14210 [Saprospiraceae bacterium]
MKIIKIFTLSMFLIFSITLFSQSISNLGVGYGKINELNFENFYDGLFINNEYNSIHGFFDIKLPQSNFITKISANFNSFDDNNAYESLIKEQLSTDVGFGLIIFNKKRIQFPIYECIGYSSFKIENVRYYGYSLSFNPTMKLYISNTIGIYLNYNNYIFLINKRGESILENEYKGKGSNISIGLFFSIYNKK